MPPRFDDNAADLLEPRRDGLTHREAFIDLYNELSGHYAEFGAARGADEANQGFAPDFAFVRYLGSRLTATMPPKDSRWVLDQVMDVEAPEAVKIVRVGFRQPAVAAAAHRAAHDDERRLSA